MITIPEVLPHFVSYYKNNCAWGSLHIVLSDGNVKDDNVKFCIGYAEQVGDAEGKRLAEILLTMSKTQRGKIPKSVDIAIRDERDMR